MTTIESTSTAAPDHHDLRLPPSELRPARRQCRRCVSSREADIHDFCSTVSACGDSFVGPPPRSRDDDMLHAIQHSMVVDDLGEDPDRWLVIGPDRAANLLEVIVLVTAEGDEVIIHAMPLRALYRKLLDP